MAIDSHMHINHLVLPNKEKQIMSINSNPSIESVINVGLNIDTSKESILIAKENPKFYSAIGIHPLYIENQDINSILTLANHSKIVAIGEIDLDTTKCNLNELRKYLIQQIIIANELNLPVIIHSNNLNKMVIETFEKYENQNMGVFFIAFSQIQKIYTI